MTNAAATSKHTPGPWRLVGTDTQSCTDGIGILGSKGLFLANVFHDGESDAELAKQVANARLIGAAPELLEACELARENCEILPDTAKTEVLVAALEAAMGKARGE